MVLAHSLLLLTALALKACFLPDLPLIWHRAFLPPLKPGLSNSLLPASQELGREQIRLMPKTGGGEDQVPAADFFVAPYPLLYPQCGHRIHPRSAPCRSQARRDRNQQLQPADGRKHCGIKRLCLVEHAADEPHRGGTRGQSDQ